MRTIVPLVLVFSGAASMALAQPTGTLLDQNRVDRAPPKATRAAPQPPGQAVAPSISTTPPASATALRSVELAGSSLPEAAVQAAVRPFVGRPLDRATITAAAEAISALYKQSQVALYTVEAPQQDLTSGNLKLRAIEGRVAQVAIGKDGAGRTIPLVQAYAAPLPEERPLTRRTLERQLSLMRDIPGVTLTPQVLRGQAPGDVVMALDVKQRSSDLSLGLTTRGTKSLGRYQVQGDYSRYSLLRPGDLTTVSVAAPIQVSRMQFASLAHSQPLGDDGLRVQASTAYLRTKPKGAAKAGDAYFAAVQLSYPLIRGYERNLYLTAAVDGLNSSNASFGQVAASEHTRVARGAAVWSDQKPRRALLASGTLSAGSAKATNILPGFEPNDDFTKLNLRGGFDLALGKVMVVRTKAVAQISRDRLPASELFSLGGDEFGRAYDASALMGDRGEAGAVELAVRPIRAAGSDLAGTEVYGFAEKGRVRVASRGGFPSASADLATAGGGVRVAWKRRTNVGVELAYGLDAPPGLKEGAWRLGFTLRTNP